MALPVIRILEKPLVRECLAEMLGTSILIFLGCGAVAQKVLSENSAGNNLTMTIGFSIGLAMAVWVTAGTSGGHLNPAFSLARVCVGQLKLLIFLYYIIAQFIGAFLGAAAVYILYYDALMDFTGGKVSLNGMNESGHIFAPYPPRPHSIWWGLFEQVAETAMLTVSFLLIKDYLEPLAAGLVLMVVSMLLGLNCGYPLNPARDLGSRLFAAMAGWGTAVFSAGNYWWWIPVVGPMIGGPIGALLYKLVITLYGTQEVEEDGKTKRKKPKKASSKKS